MYMHVTIGILTGVVYALTSWKSKPENETEKFDTAKFVKTVLICGIVGGIGANMGLDITHFDIVLMGSMGVAVSKVVSILYGLIFNRAVPTVKKLKTKHFDSKEVTDKNVKNKVNTKNKKKK